MPRRRPFRYHTLLRVRRRQEELKAAGLATTQRQIRGAENLRDTIVAQQIAALDEAGQRAQREFDARDIRRYYQYERHLARQAVEKDAEIARLRQVEAERRAELEEAMKHRRIVEKLKERRQKDFFADLNKEIQALGDEASVNHAAVARIGKPKGGSPAASVP